MIGIACVCYKLWFCCVKDKSDLSILSRLCDPLQPGMPDHTSTGEEYRLFGVGIGEIDEWSGIQGKREDEVDKSRRGRRR